MKNIISPFAWEKDFPPVFCHTSISFIKRCRGYDDAKHGDSRAACAVVSACVKPHRLSALRTNYRSAVLLPVISRNKLPEALAREIGLRTNSRVRMTGQVERKQMSGAERLLFKPEFTGAVKKGESYILVDDVLCRGGTVSALRKYVLESGGSVVAVAVLAHSRGSAYLGAAPDSVNMLGQKFEHGRITSILKSHRIIEDLRELTYPEIKYLLRFKEAGKIEAALDRYMPNS